MCVIQLTKLGLTFSDFKGVAFEVCIQYSKLDTALFSFTIIQVPIEKKKTFWQTTGKQVLKNPQKFKNGHQDREQRLKTMARKEVEVEKTRRGRQQHSTGNRISWCMYRDFPTFGTVTNSKTQP